VPVIEPKVAPASRSPTEEIIKATNPRVNTFRLREKKSRTGVFAAICPSLGGRV
jgi:hypothetical protein